MRGLRRKSREPDQPELDANLAVGSAWTMGGRLAVLAVTGLLWVAVFSGPAALAVAGWVAAQPDVAPVVSAEVDQGRIDDELQAQEFAVRTVSIWLRADSSQTELVQALLPRLGYSTLPTQGMEVADAMVAGSELSEDGVWSVTVAATVKDSRQTSRRFFVLPVQVRGGAAVAVAMPAEVPATLISQLPELDYPVEVGRTSPLQVTSTEFLGAYLAGQGDVARFVSPEVTIPAVTPAPFTAVEVTKVLAHSSVGEVPREGAELDVLVTAEASAGEQEHVEVQYPLLMRVRDGRWEVAAIRVAPLLSSSAPDGSSAPPVQSATPSSVSSGSASPTESTKGS